MTTFLVLALLLVYEVQVVLPVDRNGSSEQTTSSWLYQWSTVISAVAFVIMGCFLKRLTDVPTVEIKKNYTVVAGEKVKLKCCASAFPCIKSVSWKHILPEGETKQLDIDQQKYTSTKPNHIVINQTLKSDEGEYVCIVSNWFGKTQSKHTKLTVEGDLPTVKISERNYTAVLGEQVKLECTISATPWITTVSWQRISPEEQPVALDIDEIKYTGSKPNDPHLSINDIKKNDEGNYVCTVSNLCGKRQSAPTKLKVKGGPPMLNMKAKLLYKTEGELVLLKCTVNAEPPASDITWTKEGCERKIAIDNSKYFGGSLKTPSLFIDETESHDEGIYICEAENIAGPGSNFVHLTINSKTAKITGIETVNQDTPEALQEKIVTRHAEMVISLADYIYSTADDWQKFKVLLSAYLKPVDIGQDNLYHYVQKLIDMKNIDYGRYDKFYEVVNKTHPRISRIIVKAESDIEIMKNGRRPNETDYKVKIKSDGDFNSKLPEQCSAQITKQLPEVKHRINATGESGNISIMILENKLTYVTCSYRIH
ncbi:roundabout homolog 2-like [Mizuhopecten yessoensis]|uniref:roundabout homolog 2-like n=1 Tax=Mizuhopecten yessoensis TaxID=6573 RepID=UPI000B458BD3|nr:roundabout homolog 2-like [Mizuhopecten yessoensis]XP_021350226.1 roundabout homolog 2-like [Mizuhopecten yessoensis]